MKIKSPCRECPDVGCGAYHSKCEKYLAFVEEGKSNKRPYTEYEHINYLTRRSWKRKRRSNNGK